MAYKRSRANFEADLAPPYALFGTPLPPLDSDARDDGSYVPLWKQDARDEQGRKRFHGAFTGGFSAGYYNTVGSKEGWAPSTFVSSRTNRRKDAQPVRAEDLMDDEDRALAAEAQQLQTQDSFAGFGSTVEDQIRRGLLSDLFRPAGETMGVKLLQKMGWRQGQGVGPRVRRKARDEDQSTADAPDGQTHLFAPENSRMVAFNRKKDRMGLGYAGEERLGREKSPAPRRDEDEDEDDSTTFGPLSKPKTKVKRSAFGVGVLNDTGSDEEDPYDMGPKISYNRIIGGDKKKRKGGIIANSSKGSAQPTFMSKKLGQRINNGFRKCYDGRLPLDGFVLASSLILNDNENKHPPPDVPEGWESSKLGVSTTVSDASTYQSTADAARASAMDPGRRAAVLGEQQLPGKSIFDYLSTAARDRLASATGRSNLPLARGEAAPEGWQRSEADRQKTMWDFVPKLDSSVAAAALQRGTSGWMPYAEDEAKRARYRSFLEISSGQRDSLPERVTGASTDDWVKEMREFAQAAEVFKPISSLMASRFTSSSSSPQLASDATPAASDKPEKPEESAEAAAKIGMFGPMTRSRLNFYPTRLLCKRFNVKPPAHADPGKAPAGEDPISESRLDIVSQTKMEQMMREAGRSRPASTTAEELVPTSTEGVQPQKNQQVDAEVNEAIEAERPGDAVFKAIFGSDSEDE